MFPVTINNKIYNVPSTFSDVNIEQMIWLQSKTDNLPDDVKGYYKPENEERKQLNSDNDKIRVDFEREVFAYLCKIDKATIEKTNAQNIECLFNITLLRFIYAALYYFDYKSEHIKSFTYEQQCYYLPEGDEDIAGDIIPASRLTAQEFCDASDLAITNNFKVAPLLVAVLCRPKDEAYNERTAQKRAKSLIKLPMNIYLELYILIKEAHEYQAKENPECYGKGSKGESGKAMTWNETLYNVCDEKPSEIPFVQKMNVCDFMNFLNGKIKQQKEKWNIMSKLAF